MLIVMRKGCADRDTDRVLRRIAELGRTGRALLLGDRRVIGVAGGGPALDPADLAGIEGIEQVLRVDRPYTLASRESRPDRTVVGLGGAEIGGRTGPVLIAGPCAVEDEAALLDLAHRLKAAGAHALRGGAYKPRTSPYSFQGLGPAGLEILARVRERVGLPIVTEVLDEESLAGAAEFADVLQVGARNMHNYALLRRAGRVGKPVLLKRGMNATLEEWLLAAEYVLAEGNARVVLCERGIRTFSDHSRYTLDLSVVPAIREVSHLPVVVDPSHGTGRRSRVPAMARAAIAAGADGILVEVHPEPARALSDGPQALTPAEFAALAGDLRTLSAALRQGAEAVPVIRVDLGDRTASVLDGGSLWLDGGAMFGVVPKPLWSRRREPDDANRIRLAMNVVLVEDGRTRTLIDVGAGGRWSDKERGIYRLDERSAAALLEPAGLVPADVDRVVLSHLHFDHAGGGVERGADGSLGAAFPEAEYVVQRGEVEFSRLAHERVRASYRPDDVEPLVAEPGRVRRIDGDGGIAPGLEARLAPGHTPHHQVVLVHGGRRTLAFLADLVPTATHVRVPWVMGFDVEPMATIASKRRLLPEALRRDWLVVFEHDHEVPLATLHEDEDGRIVARAVPGD